MVNFRRWSFFFKLVWISTIGAIVRHTYHQPVNLMPTALKWGLLLGIFSISSLCLEAQDINKPFSNPALFYGTSFGNYFSVLYRQGKYIEMLRFTSSNCLLKYKQNLVLRLYQEMDWGYNMKLASISSQGDTLILNYEANINNTVHMGRIPVIIENDSCKILLTDDSFSKGIDGLRGKRKWVVRKA